VGDHHAAADDNWLGWNAPPSVFVAGEVDDGVSGCGRSALAPGQVASNGFSQVDQC